ncbi:MAG: hypothetical protein PHG49_02585 [Candidatus Pacebacteria bacterium]|nr:hypothetical protein [Candidatus Paceibacterota bacterium]
MSRPSSKDASRMFSRQPNKLAKEQCFTLSGAIYVGRKNVPSMT